MKELLIEIREYLKGEITNQVKKGAQFEDNYDLEAFVRKIDDVLKDNPISRDNWERKNVKPCTDGFMKFQVSQ